LKITHGSHNPEHPSNIHNQITKENIMSAKRKTIIARLARTLAATVVGLLAAWAAGPDALELVGNVQAQSFVTMVVVPTLITLDKMLRYGSDADE